MATKALSLRANFSWTFVGNVIYAASQWGMLMVLARLGSPEMVGQFALGLAVTAPIVLFANLELRQVIATDTSQAYPFSIYFSLRAVTFVLSLVIIVSISLPVYTIETVIIIVLVGISKCVESLSDIIYGLLQQHEHMDRVSQSMILKGPLSVLALAGGLIVTNSLAGSIVFLISVWLIIFLFYDIRSMTYLVGKINLLSGLTRVSVMVKLARIALPLGFGAMLVSLNANIPRYIVNHYLGDAQLGIYAAMAYMIVAGTTVMGALAQSAVPRLAAYYAEHHMSAFFRLVRFLFLLACFVGSLGVVAAVIFGEWALGVLYGPEYAAQSEVFIWIMVAAGINYVTYAGRYIIISMQAFKMITLLTFISTVIVLILSLIFVPEGGLSGVASALVITRFIELICMTLIIVSVVRKHNISVTGI